MKIDVEQEHDVCIVRLSGHLVTGTDPVFLQAKADEVRYRCGKILVDMRELASIGSTGIGFLLGIYATTSKNPRGRFVVVGPQPRVQQIFEITRLNGILRIVPDLASGLAVLGEAEAAAGGR